MKFNQKLTNMLFLMLPMIFTDPAEGAALAIETFNRNYFESGFLANKLVSKSAIERRKKIRQLKEKVLKERFEETTKKVIENGIVKKQIIRIADDGKGTRKKTVINKTIDREGKVFTNRSESIQKY